MVLYFLRFSGGNVMVSWHSHARVWKNQALSHVARGWYALKAKRALSESLKSWQDPGGIDNKEVRWEIS